MTRLPCIAKRRFSGLEGHQPLRQQIEHRSRRVGPFDHPCRPNRLDDREEVAPGAPHGRVERTGGKVHVAEHGGRRVRSAGWRRGLRHASAVRTGGWERRERS